MFVCQYQQLRTEKRSLYLPRSEVIANLRVGRGRGLLALSGCLSSMVVTAVIDLRESVSRMRRACRLGAVAIVVVFTLGLCVHYGVTYDENWPHPTGEQLAEDPGEWDGPAG